MSEQQLFVAMIERFSAVSTAERSWYNVSAGEDNTTIVELAGTREGTCIFTFDADGTLVETMGTDL